MDVYTEEEEQADEIVDETQLQEIVDVEKEDDGEEFFQVETSSGIVAIDGNLLVYSRLLSDIVQADYASPIQAPNISLETLNEILQLIIASVHSPDTLQNKFEQTSKEKLMELRNGCTYLEIQYVNDLIVSFLASKMSTLSPAELAKFLNVVDDWESPEERQKIRVYNGLPYKAIS
jgi:hypothetical protein